MALALGASAGCGHPPAASGGAHPASPVASVGSVAPSASGSSSAGDGPAAPHAVALARLLRASWGSRLDKRRTFSLPLPDAAQWTHVKFWGVTTLAGWRYGDEHHAVLAAFTFPAKDSPPSIEACSDAFLAWGRSRAQAFDLSVGDMRVEDVPWAGARDSQLATLRVYVLDAERRSVFGTSRYPSAFAIYPAWSDACLVIGVSVPEDDAGEVAGRLRDRFVRDALPALTARPGAGSSALEAQIDVD
ncbi:MAG: hypothetical protein NVSMB47_05560 [Polyangiales bacterium]